MATPQPYARIVPGFEDHDSERLVRRGDEDHVGRVVGIHEVGRAGGRLEDANAIGHTEALGPLLEIREVVRRRVRP